MTNATETVLNVLRSHESDVGPAELRDLFRGNTAFRSLEDLASAIGERGYLPTLRGTNPEHNRVTTLTRAEMHDAYPELSGAEFEAEFERVKRETETAEMKAARECDRLRLGMLERGLCVWPDPSVDETLRIPKAVRIAYTIAA